MLPSIHIYFLDNFFHRRYDQDGNEEYPYFPFKLTLEPTGMVKFTESASSMLDFMQQYIDKIPNGTDLYSVIAHANPDDHTGIELGKLAVVDKCILSKYGDEKLFFQHHRSEEDFEYMPEWESHCLNECI